MPLTDYMMQILECGGAVSMMKTKTVVVIATGGTIAGVRDNERSSAYHSGELAKLFNHLGARKDVAGSFDGSHGTGSRCITG